MIYQKDLVSVSDSESIVKAVETLSAFWENRAYGKHPFYTLGAASYLDASAGHEKAYRLKAAKINPILQTHFSSLYATLTEFFQNELNVDVAYETDFALPGFHIYLFDKLFEQSVGSIHFDQQFNNMRWQYEEIDWDHPISYTLPLCLPKHGGGLHYWDIKSNDERLKGRYAEQLIEEMPMHLLKYEVGKIVWHDGLLLHRIAPAVEMDPNDRRITLQGHGLICDGIMRLYW